MQTPHQPGSNLLPTPLFARCSLRRHKQLAGQLRRCPTLEDLRTLLKSLEVSEKLLHLAAMLTPGGAAAAKERRLQQRRDKRRAAAAATVAAAARSMDWDAGREEAWEEHEQQLRRQPVKGEPSKETEEGQQQAAGAASRHGGPAAVGRRLRVWLRLDSRQAAQQHDGRVAEFTPTGCVPACLPARRAACLGGMACRDSCTCTPHIQTHALTQP